MFTIFGPWLFTIAYKISEDAVLEKYRDEQYINNSKALAAYQLR